MKYIFYIAVILFMLSCASASTENLGEEGFPCNKENKCNDGLLCVDNLCIKSECSDTTCEEWQKCDSKSQKCIPKEGFCAENNDCTTPQICNSETHKCQDYNPCNENPCKEEHRSICKINEDYEEHYICLCDEGYTLVNNKCISDDKCRPNPCMNNSNGQTLCIPSEENEEGYLCTCEEGYKLKDEICKKIINPCENNPCIENEGDRFLCVVTDDTSVDGYECLTPQCDDLDTCENEGEIKCSDNKIIKCALDIQTYCQVWQEENDCGVGECITEDDGNVYCTCQECNPDDFISTCSQDLKSFEYCDDTDGCFRIKTQKCNDNTHCENTAQAIPACVETTCEDECEANQINCIETQDGSLLSHCKLKSNGCYDYDIENSLNCTQLNMQCQRYEGDYQCIGGEGGNTCDEAVEILSSGIWTGNTYGGENNLTGCSGDMSGNEIVYFIDLEEGQHLDLRLEAESGTWILGDIGLYVMKNCDPDDYCREKRSLRRASLYLYDMSGRFYIFIDSEDRSYEYRLQVDLH